MKKLFVFFKLHIFLIIFIGVISFLLLEGIEMWKLSASIQKINYSVVDGEDYQYLEVDFPKMDLSGIPNIHDYDDDGIENSLDILEGAKIFIAADPVYEDGYYEGGYPPLGTGVCTDVIAYALLNAGYNLRDMVDQDIRFNRGLYPHILSVDKNIDYRRVQNLVIFFDRYAEVLTTEIKNPDDWQPSDILVFPHHIGILSDKKNDNGYPYIIHHGGQENYEEDVLEKSTVIRHYRFAK